MSSGNIHKLSALKIKKIRKAGRYSDGNCLYLVIKDTGARQWVLRLVIRGKRHDMGLGSSTLVSLEEARDLARQYRRIAREGGDPLIARQRDLGLLITVRDAAMKVHELNAPSWKNDKHTDQWLTSLELHVFPIIGHLAVCEVTSADILKVLAPIWNTKADTAKKIRQRLRMIIRWAKAQGYYSGDDPVELAEQALPRLKASGTHFKSVAYDDLPDIVNKLQDSQISLPTRLALEFLILSACRTTEVLEANWREIDIEKRLWIIPAERMKAGKAHEVPLRLSRQSLLIIRTTSMSY